jgi:hypothetical protein
MEKERWEKRRVVSLCGWRRWWWRRGMIALRRRLRWSGG